MTPGSEEWVDSVCRKAYTIMLENCGGDLDPKNHGWSSHDDLYYKICALPKYGVKFDTIKICSVLNRCLADLDFPLDDFEEDEGVVEFGSDTFNVSTIKDSNGIQHIELELVNPIV